MSNERAIQIAYFLFRVVTGMLFMQHGGQKIFDWFGGIPAEFGGRPDLLSQSGVGGMIEFGCGLLVMIGLLTRPAAFLASGTMAVAYFQFHFKAEKFWPMQNGGEAAVLFCFIFLVIFAFGGGPWSLDSMVWGKRASAEST